MRVALIAGFVLGVAAPALVWGGTFQPQHIAADADWVMHLDMEAVESSDALQNLYEERVSEHQFVRSLEEGRWDLQIDFQGEIRGVTLYGEKLSQLQGVLLLYMEEGSGNGSADVPDLPGHRTIAYQGEKLHTWSWPGEKQPAFAAAFPQENLVVWAGNVELLKSAIDVLQGRAATLEDEETLLSADSPDGTVFLVRAAGVEKAEETKGEPWVGGLRAFSYSEGVGDGKWFGNFVADTGTPQINKHVKSVVDGLISAYWLAYGEKQDPQEKQKPGSAMTVSVDGGNVKLHVEGSVNELAAEFRELWQWMNEKPAPSRQSPDRDREKKRAKQ